MGKEREYGGRKPLAKDQKKSEAFRVRLTKQEIEKIKDLYSKSFHSNFSALIRDILLNKRVEVDVRNVEISSLLSKIETTKKTCTNLSRTKGSENIEVKLLIEEVKSQLVEIKSIVDSMKKTDLYLTDLRTIPDTEKYKEYYYYLNR